MHWQEALNARLAHAPAISLELGRNCSWPPFLETRGTAVGGRGPGAEPAAQALTVAAPAGWGQSRWQALLLPERYKQSEPRPAGYSSEVRPTCSEPSPRAISPSSDRRVKLRAQTCVLQLRNHVGVRSPVLLCCSHSRSCRESLAYTQQVPASCDSYEANWLRRVWYAHIRSSAAITRDL